MFLFDFNKKGLYGKPADEDNKEAARAQEDETMEFNMQEIGRKIAHFRKAKNMTQMNLADQMNISYQAVSNWERGQTMPDISKLPELASILGCSVDNLLGNERAADIVQHIVEKSELKEAISAEELSAVAPALEPEETKRIFEEQTTGKKESTWTIRDLMQLAPFLDEDLLSNYVRQLASNGISLREISQLAPFLDSETLAALCRMEVENSDDISAISSLAPFLDSEDLGQLLHAYIASGKKIDQIVAFAPFLDSDDLHAIVKHALAQGGELSSITSLAPFLDRETLQLILEKSFTNKKND